SWLRNPDGLPRVGQVEVVLVVEGGLVPVEDLVVDRRSGCRNLPDVAELLLAVLRELGHAEAPALHAEAPRRALEAEQSVAEGDALHRGAALHEDRGRALR